MPLTDMREVLDHARLHAYAIASFDVTALETLQAILRAAEQTQSPVILLVDARDAEKRDFSVFMAAVECAAIACLVPVALQARVSSVEAVVSAINLGCNGIRIDGLLGAPEANQDLMRRMVATAHDCGVAVEGLAFETPLDQALAAVLVDRNAMRRLNGPVTIPLAWDIHGASLEAHCAELMQNGVAKINFGQPDAEQTQALQTQVEQKLRSLGAAGRAGDIIQQCRHWRPVQHVIIYNAAGTAEEAITNIMARGVTVLSTIPGVRRVFTGRAVAEKAPYRYCWLVEFVHTKVIETYRAHPAHIAFADNYFRPIAADRISIDFADEPRPG